MFSRDYFAADYFATDYWFGDGDGAAAEVPTGGAQTLLSGQPLEPEPDDELLLLLH